MTLVYIDIDNNKVTIIENDTFFSLDFTDLSEVSRLLSNKKVHYVTNIDIVDGNSILSLISAASFLFCS